MKASEWSYLHKSFFHVLTKHWEHVSTMLTFNPDKSSHNGKNQEKKYNFFILVIILNAANHRFFSTFVGSSSLPSYLGTQLNHWKLNTDLLKLIKIKAFRMGSSKPTLLSIYTVCLYILTGVSGIFLLPHFCGRNMMIRKWQINILQRIFSYSKLFR